MKEAKKRLDKNSLAYVERKKEIRLLIFLLILFSLLFIFIFIIFIREFFIEGIRLAPNTVSIIDCGTLNQANTEYLLQNDVTNPGDCFIITANNVILNGQGRKIVYSSSGGSDRYGVRVIGTDSAVIRNSIIEDGSPDGRSDYAVYLDGTTNSIVESSTLRTYNSSAVRLIGSNRSQILYNVFDIKSEGIQLTASSHNTIYGNNMTTSVPLDDPIKNTRSIYINSGSDYNIVSNNNISTFKINGFGVQLQASSNNVVEDGDIITVSDSADALRIFGSNTYNNTFRRLNLITSGANGASGIVISTGSNSFSIEDSIIDAPASSDLDIIGSVDGGEWNFTNVTFSDKSWSSGTNGTLNIYWYFDTKVFDNANNPLNYAAVKGTDNFATEVFNLNTGGSNSIPSQTLLESKQINGGNSVLFIPYSVQYSKVGYWTDSDPIVLGANIFIPKQLNDNIPPTITIFSPKVQTYATNNSIELNYSAEDLGGGLRSCKYNFDNGANVSSSCNLNTTFSISGGLHTLYVSADDNYGNLGIGNVTFQISLNLPSIVLSSPLNGAYLNYKDNIYFKHISTDSGSIVNCSLYGDFTGNFSVYQTDNVIINGAENSFDLVNLSEGIYKWNVLCRDNSGNEAFALNNFSLGVDITKPIISDISNPVVYPSNVLCSRTISLDYTINEGNKDYCYYNVINSSGIVISNTNISSCGSTTFNIGSVNERKNLTLSLTAADKAGNMNNLSRTFYVDTNDNSCTNATSQNNTNTQTNVNQFKQNNNATNNKTIQNNQNINPNPEDDNSGVEPLKIQKVSLRNNATLFSVKDGENVVLDINGKENNALFEIDKDIVRLELGSGKYEIKKGSMISVLVGDSKIYIGVKELTSSSASLIAGLNESNVKKQLIGEGTSRKTVAYILIILVMILIISAVVVILFYIIKSKPKEEQQPNFSGSERNNVSNGGQPRQ